MRSERRRESNQDGGFAQEDETEAQFEEQRHVAQHQGPLPRRRDGRRQGRACATETPGQGIMEVGGGGGEGSV